MRWLILLAVLCALVWLIQRYVFAPHYTEPARRQFILETLRTSAFEQLSHSREKGPYLFHGRTLGAKWITYPRPDVGPQAITLEFDMQPTSGKMWGNISHSEFILIRGPDHLQKIKDKLKHSDSYEEYCVYPKEWVGPSVKF